MRVDEIALSPGTVLVLTWAGDADPAMVAHAFGADLANPDHLEVFEATKIAPVGLTAYLAEGHGIDPADLAGEAARLDGLTGTLAVLSARAFAGGRGTVTMVAGLALVATFREAAAKTGAPLPIETESAKGNLSGGAPAKSDARVGGMVAMVVLVFLALFVAFFVLAGG